jgi:transcription elongation factor Elf1
LLCCFYNHAVKLPDLPRLFTCPICNTQNHKLHINNQAVKWLLKKSAENKIEAHDQTIHVRSKIDVGSTFAFTMKKA